MTWMLGQSVSSASLLTTQNWEKWPICPEGHAAIQRNLTRLEKWADRNIMQINKGKTKILDQQRNNLRQQYILGTTQLESSFPEKVLGVLVDTKVNVSEPALTVPLCQRRFMDSGLH